jgi:phosphoglycolate phosphatase-like HAD superfamily hydrolase
VTTSILGPGPVVDFDGTLATLPVAWRALRSQLGVHRVDELWQPGRADGWAVVTRAEEEAAATAEPLPGVLEALAPAEVVAVLTSNAETAVWRFLDRFPDLRARAAAVVGRETLAGPKSEYHVFARGFRRCADATAVARAGGEVVYVGDRAYELRFARRMGARAVHVDDLVRA